MKIYTNKNFAGFYRVWTAAVVVAETVKKAAMQLNVELKKMGLPESAQWRLLKIWCSMINFELDGMKYRICFKHYTREQLLDPENQERLPNLNKPSNGATYAILQKRVGDEWQIQSFQSAFCMFLDTFSRARGRKLALKRLLESVDVFKNRSEGKGVHYVNPERNRDLRLKIWRLYFDKVRAFDRPLKNN